MAFKTTIEVEALSAHLERSRTVLLTKSEEPGDSELQRISISLFLYALILSSHHGAIKDRIKNFNQTESS